MPGWDEASVDELLADPIVRDLMAADSIDPTELRALLYNVQRTIECYAIERGSPTSLAGFYNSTPSLIPRSTPTGSADYSRLSIAPLGSVFRGETGCTARS